MRSLPYAATKCLTRPKRTKKGGSGEPPCSKVRLRRYRRVSFENRQYAELIDFHTVLPENIILQFQ
jgi:hypothetical protein